MADEFVCFERGNRLWFGRVAFERKDLILVDVVTPGTRFAAEQARASIISPESVIGRGSRYAMQDAASAGNQLLRPRPSMDAVIAAAKAEMKRNTQSAGK